MKAIILAGGEGRRLRPVTGETPKPLCPLLGRPVMEHILRLLARQGFTEVCAAVKYRAEEIEAAFGDGSALGLTLSYRVEKEPLGTAGGVKNCMDWVGDGDFLVVSGDAAFDFDLAALVQAHRDSGAAATLALARSAEPLPYGLAVTDGDGLVRAFVEKPGWPQVVTDLVNTGIYVLSPRAMTQVPAGRAFDFAKDLFPLLLRQGEQLLGVAAEGYWCDIGSPLAYYRCCVDALEGRLRLEPGEGFAVAAAPKPEPEPAGLDCPVPAARRGLFRWAEPAQSPLRAAHPPLAEPSGRAHRGARRGRGIRPLARALGPRGRPRAGAVIRRPRPPAPGC